MRLQNQMVHDGHWLFKKRSYLPLILLFIALISMWIKRSLYAQDYLWYDLICLVIALSGEFIRIISVGYSANRTSGRNTKGQVANELNTTGIYSLLRNPLYVGNFLMWLGVAMFTYIYWLIAVFCLIFWMYYERIIMAEESYLAGKFGEEYDNYALRVPCIFPCRFHYISPKYSFRIKKVLRQENPSLYGLIISFVILDVMKEFFYSGKLYTERHWLIIGSVWTVVYISLRMAKKYTSLLKKDPQRLKSSN